MSISETVRAWVDVDLTALRENFRRVRDRTGPAPAIIPMVKANGYGLGAERVVRGLEPLDPWGYGVAAVSEGRALREAGVRRPIIVFSPLPPHAVAGAVEADLTVCVSDLGGLARCREAATADRPLDIHVEIDTGMGRAGFDWRGVERWANAVYEHTGPELRWAGVFTHFQGADAPDPTATREQWDRFQRTLDALPIARDELMVHAANSAAALRWREYALDAVRPGIYLYGGHPASDVAAAELPPPKSVPSVRARVALIKEVDAGHTVGYGATHTARGPERWATLGIGYGDGLPRLLSNRGGAIIRGRRVPIVGRISMDMTVVDVTDVPEATVGDVATLIGSDGDERITLEDVAGQARTISYEILTGLAPRLPRLERDDGGDE